MRDGLSSIPLLSSSTRKRLWLCLKVRSVGYGLYYLLPGLCRPIPTSNREQGGLPRKPIGRRTRRGRCRWTRSSPQEVIRINRRVLIFRQVVVNAAEKSLVAESATQHVKNEGAF